MVEWIERGTDRPDERCPLVLRQLVAVLAVELLPDEPGRSLCVDEQAVEVEQEPPGCHTLSLADGFTPRAACRQVAQRRDPRGRPPLLSVTPQSWPTRSRE